MPEIFLVIPCFRERERLPRFLPRLCETLSRNQLPVSVLAVDDGSGPDIANWLQVYCEDIARRFPLLRPPLIKPKNEGKGAAVYSGWREADEDAAWVAFVDADGAVSAEEVARVCKLICKGAATQEAVFAVRTGEAGTTVRRKWRRKLSGQMFRALVKSLFRFPIADTQCGFKFVRRDWFKHIEPTLTEKHYVFDVELTFRLLEAGASIGTVPIDWEESPGSRLRAGSVLGMIRGVRALKQRLGDWRKNRGGSEITDSGVQ